MPTFIQSIPFAKRFEAVLRNGTRPASPAGLGDAYWNAVGEVLSVANTDGSAWIEYDLSLIAARTAANGGTGFTSFTTGDLLVGNPAAALSKLGVGADGDVLTANSLQPTGIDYETLGAMGGVQETICSFVDRTTIPPGTATVVPADTLSGNSVSDFSIVSTVLTCVTAADYIVRAEISMSIVWFGANAVFRIEVYQNTTLVSEGSYFFQNPAEVGLTPCCITPTALVTLASSDTITVKIFQGGTSDETLYNEDPFVSQISLTKLL